MSPRDLSDDERELTPDEKALVATTLSQKDDKGYNWLTGNLVTTVKTTNKERKMKISPKELESGRKAYDYLMGALRKKGLTEMSPYGVSIDKRPDGKVKVYLMGDDAQNGEWHSGPTQSNKVVGAVIGELKGVAAAKRIRVQKGVGDSMLIFDNVADLVSVIDVLAPAKTGSAKKKGSSRG